MQLCQSLKKIKLSKLCKLDNLCEEHFNFDYIYSEQATKTILQYKCIMYKCIKSLKTFYLNNTQLSAKATLEFSLYLMTINVFTTIELKSKRTSEALNTFPLLSF